MKKKKQLFEFIVVMQIAMNFHGLFFIIVHNVKKEEKWWMTWQFFKSYLTEWMNCRTIDDCSLEQFLMVARKFWFKGTGTKATM